MAKKKKSPFKSNKHEIMYNLINSGLAAGLVILGSCADGQITLKGFGVGVIAGLIVLIAKFKEYWDGQAGEYTRNIASFVGPISL